jgi:hypothetical protein
LTRPQQSTTCIHAWNTLETHFFSSISRSAYLAIALSIITMSGTDKLNSSLDDILKTTRGSNARRGRGGHRSGAGRRAADGPVGGVQKPTKQPKQTKPAAVTPTGPAGGETKIVISNLVSHATYKEQYDPLTIPSR